MEVSILRVINIGNLLSKIFPQWIVVASRTNKHMVVKIHSYSNLRPNKLYIRLLRENYIDNLEKFKLHLSSSGKSVQ